MPLDLLVPDLLLPADAPAAMRALRLPGLERWLARGDLEAAAGGGASAWLAAAYGLAEPAPLAAICLAGEGRAQPGPWLRADPVFMRIDRDAVTLHDAAMLDVKGGEAAAIVATLNSIYGADGLEFLAAAPDRWYVRVPAGELPSTTSLEAARGRNVFRLLPVRQGRINWASALTEIQMTLAGHDVNREREARSLPLVNSVWFWGEGATPGSVARPYGHVHARDVFARGLSRLSAATLNGVPASIADLDLVSASDSMLVVLDDLNAPLHRADGEAWKAAAENLDEHWFRGLGGAIERFDRVRLVMPRENATLIATLTPAARRRWYRGRKPLPHG